jgi:hypothetical protein
MPGNRASDSLIRKYGLVAVVVVALLGMQRETLRSEREDRRRASDAQIAAIRDQTDSLARAFDRTSAALLSVEARVANVETGLDWMRGAATGRLKCPDLTCPKPAPCPACPAALPTTVVVQAPAAPTPATKEAPPPPAIETIKPPRKSWGSSR